MRGDINATELYQDREFLLRVGYGIYDVPFGSGGGVGFEDVHNFSYVSDKSQEEDPKLYRRKVFNLVGRYYPNDLARALWQKFYEYQGHLSRKQRREVGLEEAAQEWLEHYGHDYFKAWAFQQQEVPFRMRNQAEPARGWVEVAVCQVWPQWRELVAAGFNLPVILLASMLEMSHSKGRRDEHYLRVVARVSGHRIKEQAELEKRRYEIEQLEAYLSKLLGEKVDTRVATIEYYRRLNLVAEIEGQPLGHSRVSAPAC